MTWAEFVDSEYNMEYFSDYDDKVFFWEDEYAKDWLNYQGWAVLLNTYDAYDSILEVTVKGNEIIESGKTYYAVP